MRMKDIARLADVSVATVSYVVNNTRPVSEETRQKVLAVIKENHFLPNRVARSLRNNHSDTLGILVEDVRAFFVPEIINGITEYAQAEGQHILLSDLHFLEKLYNQYDKTPDYKNEINNAIQLLFSAKVDGIVFVGMHDRDVTGVFETYSKPVVLAYCYTTQEGLVSVTYDSEQVSQDVVRLLVSRGHTRIATVTGPKDSYPAKQRLSGYLHALAEAGLAQDAAYTRTGDWSYHSGYQAAVVLLSLPQRPTAVYVHNDTMAVGVMNAVYDMGLHAPDDISVVGFDDMEYSDYMRPRLTTVRMPLRQIGYESAKAVFHMRDQNPVESLRLPCQLVLRDSVATLERGRDVQLTIDN